MDIVSLKGKTALVVAPHPDDEVLGCGGTIGRLSDAGVRVEALIATKGDELFDPELIRRGREEAGRAHGLLGVAETHFLDFPAAKLDTVPQHQLNRGISEIFKQVKPQLLFIPFSGDLHSDHQAVHNACMVAARPGLTEINAIHCYEVLSSTNWSGQAVFAPFRPNVFLDISQSLEKKLEAIRVYASQMKAAPHERSEESVVALARYRGGFAGLDYAEAFMLIRRIIK